MRERRRAAALIAALLLLPAPLLAQSAPPLAVVAGDGFTDRAQSLPALLAEGAVLEPAFSANFLNAIPVEQIRSIFATLRSQHGAPQRLVSVTPSGSAGSGTVVVGFERAEVTLGLAVDADGRIAGLRITNVLTIGDSFEALSTDFAALSGAGGWGIYRIGDDGRATRLHGVNTGTSLAIGSSFKLAILAALDAEISADRMQWTDVIRIDRQSVPSSAILDWPDAAPMTLHSLATLMISVSDNRATDILLHHVGRESVERFTRRHGGLSGVNAFPMLSTLEATVLKNPALGEARSRWLAGDETQRRTVLTEYAPRWTPDDVDYAAFAAGPADIDEIEWFASPDSMASLLGWFARRGSADARAILGVNPGIPPAAASQWAYLGYKGGSEPGVIAMNFLARAADGNTYAVAMAWNDPARAVDEARFAALAARAVALTRTISR